MLISFLLAYYRRIRVPYVLQLYVRTYYYNLSTLSWYAKILFAILETKNESKKFVVGRKIWCDLTRRQVFHEWRKQQRDEKMGKPQNLEISIFLQTWPSMYGVLLRPNTYAKERKESTHRYFFVYSLSLPFIYSEWHDSFGNGAKIFFRDEFIFEVGFSREKKNRFLLQHNQSHYQKSSLEKQLSNQTSLKLPNWDCKKYTTRNVRIYGPHILNATKVKVIMWVPSVKPLFYFQESKRERKRMQIAQETAFIFLLRIMYHYIS